MKNSRKTACILTVICLAYPLSISVAQEILDPISIEKYASPLVIPPAMPRAAVINSCGKEVDYYAIAVKQFEQQILPSNFPKTTVWSYGSVNHSGTFNYPAFTIEARQDRPVRVKWINGLVDCNGNYLPHLFAVDQTLHWANPPGPRDAEGTSQEPYTGPVPIVTHMHGAHTTDESDGYTEAWYLPAAKNIPSWIKYHTGTWYNPFKEKFRLKYGVNWPTGSALFQYPMDQRPGILWYHDHTLGMTRLNVYAGPAGFCLIRPNCPEPFLPGPAPQRGDKAGKKYYEIPLAIQDRTFDVNAQLFYPRDRAFFEGLTPDQLQIPFFPEINPLNGLRSDVAPIWNPEFFGNTMVVNGRTWPFLKVEQRRYRLRLLNGCNSRFLILQMSNNMPFWVIGTEGGFLDAPVRLTQLLMQPADRLDVIVDFTGLPVGTQLVLRNLGPDEPFGGGIPGVDFTPADPNTTGQVMKFVVIPRDPYNPDKSTPPLQLALKGPAPLPNATKVRKVSLNEVDSQTVFVEVDPQGNVVLSPAGDPFGPVKALLGTVDPNGSPRPLHWSSPITENPGLCATEIWEIHNFTVDAHPIHLHEIMFEVLDRAPMSNPAARIGPEPWETGLKDTVTAYPGEITRIKARFDLPGLYVWHCHIVEHEDNEMMRPMFVGKLPFNFTP